VDRPWFPAAGYRDFSFRTYNTFLAEMMDPEFWKGDGRLGGLRPRTQRDPGLETPVGVTGAKIPENNDLGGKAPERREFSSSDSQCYLQFC